MNKTPIGNGYAPPPSMFSKRTGFGDFSHTLPPMTRDAELLQEALMKRATKPGGRRNGRVIAVALGVVVAGLVMVLV